MNRKRIAVSLICVFALVAGPLFADDFQFVFNGIEYTSHILSPVPLPTGLDIECYMPVASFSAGPLAADFRLSGGYEDRRLLRDTNTGDPIAVPDTVDGQYWYFSPNVQWTAGLVQGFAQRDDEKGNLYEAFLLYRGRWDSQNTSLASSYFSDLQGFLGHSIMLGFGYNTSKTDSRRVKSGDKFEASFEWGPNFVNSNSVSNTDYFRFNLQDRYYYPLLSYGKPEDEALNLFSVYLAGFVDTDYVGGGNGGNIPIYALQSFGGRSLRGSLGSGVRGYASAAYDASFKTVANGEIRAVGPALFGQGWCVPIAYLFADTGYYSNFSGSTNYTDKSGSISSAGAGLQFDILDMAYLGLDCGYCFPGDESLFELYKGSGASRFFWDIEFLLHF